MLSLALFSFYCYLQGSLQVVAMASNNPVDNPGRYRVDLIQQLAVEEAQLQACEHFFSGLVYRAFDAVDDSLLQTGLTSDRLAVRAAQKRKFDELRPCLRILSAIMVDKVTRIEMMKNLIA